MTPKKDATAADLLAALRQESDVEELRGALNRAHRALAKREAKTEALVHAVYTAARDAGVSVGALPPRPKKDKRRRDPEVALFHWTDWQVGKRTTSFNSDLAVERMGLVYDRSMSIVDVVRSAIPVDDAHVMLGGDMVEGTTIFPGQVWEVDSSLYDQLFTTATLIGARLRDLAGQFRQVHVWPEYGNHGRLGRIGENPPDDNVDRMAYGIAKMALAEGIASGRVVWHDEWSWHQIVQIGDYRALLVHGDEIRSFGGNHPSYGILKRTMGWKSGGGVAQFRDAYMGHFHRPDTYTLPDGGSVFLTGSIESGNEYAASAMGATGVPQQRLHFIDPSRGRVTAEYRVYAS